MKTSILLLLLLTLTTSCQSIDGQMNVTTPFEVVNDVQCDDEDDVFCDDEPIVDVIPVGSHSAKLVFNSKKSGTLMINTGDKETDIFFTVPKGQRLPRENGSITVLGSQIDQEFNIKGDVKSDVTAGPTHNTSEFCTRYETRTVCRTVGDRQVCHDETMSFPGRQQVEFHHEYTNTNMSLKLIAPQTDAQLAQFKASKNKEEKIYTYKSICF